FTGKREVLSVERTETGWGRTAEPPPRWRSLLDRALLGRVAPDDEDCDGRFSEERRAEARTARGGNGYGNGYGGESAYRDGYGQYSGGRGHQEYQAHRGGATGRRGRER